MANLFQNTSCRLSRESKASAAGATGMTPSLSIQSTLSPRKKRAFFRRTLLYVAKTALAASSITAGQYATILALYNRPWRKTTATGVMVDVLDLVRDDMNDAIYLVDGSVYIKDWWGQSITVSAAATTPRAWLVTNVADILTAITSRTPA